MRRLANATLVYTFEDSRRAEADSDGEVYVAANALYAQDAIRTTVSADSPRIDFIYVGRLELAKKVGLALEAFARLDIPGARLRIVGDGSEMANLHDLARTLRIQDNVIFEGWCDDRELLEKFYATAVASLSPGFAGLGLTQSLGFGVPMLVAEDEPHSPEIELASTGAVTWFGREDADGLARAMRDSWEQKSVVPMRQVSEWVARHYSAERMAKGISDALFGR